ncbi:MAG: hypothetical protein LBJ58_07300 [Tannerellaceae bacterium]|jgi:hypothetical protein|nr:hypothetical protein [Tannerellaceae bacterium]
MEAKLKTVLRHLQTSGSLILDKSLSNLIRLITDELSINISELLIIKQYRRIEYGLIFTPIDKFYPAGTPLADIIKDKDNVYMPKAELTSVILPSKQEEYLLQCMDAGYNTFQGIKKRHCSHEYNR